jgi:hypothetical protein
MGLDNMAEWRNWHTQLLQVQPSKEMWVQVPPQLPTPPSFLLTPQEEK